MPTIGIPSNHPTSLSKKTDNLRLNRARRDTVSRHYTSRNQFPGSATVANTTKGKPVCPQKSAEEVPQSRASTEEGIQNASPKNTTMKKAEMRRSALPTPSSLSLSAADTEQSEQPSSLDLVIDSRVDEWELILGALDENAIAAMMGFEDHLLRRPWDGLGSNQQELQGQAGSAPDGSGMNGEEEEPRQNQMDWEYPADSFQLVPQVAAPPTCYCAGADITALLLPCPASRGQSSVACREAGPEASGGTCRIPWDALAGYHKFPPIKQMKEPIKPVPAITQGSIMAHRLPARFDFGSAGAKYADSHGPPLQLYAHI
ncbi:hypothetical protein EDB80DRAFT_681010 [Ilyonectria destructans]|nr:hypothetical protein EDB80DRAFT_681010 [Ilyonectria destructans]